jgi:hypothetical protein
VTVAGVTLPSGYQHAAAIAAAFKKFLPRYA